MPAATRRLLQKRSKITTVFLVLLSLVLLGTVAVLSTAKAYFSIDSSAYILPQELGTWDEIKWGAADGLPAGWASRYPWLWGMLHRQKGAKAGIDGSTGMTQYDLDAADSEAHNLLSSATADASSASPMRDQTPRPADPNAPPEKIPRIIHQTWKEDVLPPKWQAVRQGCADMHPDYEYMLWTDASSRAFIAEHYSWFLTVFDSYPFAIQRADAIRYFVLHHYGGIYMDLDIGCNRRLDPLLRFEIILPVTRPVGVSNDLIFASKGHPFMDQVIHNLVTFNHRYLTHYPTVMFSTGPMFVSASYGLYVDAHGPAVPSTSSSPSAGFTGVRVLPKSLYGKNAKAADVPDAFFRHFYGSSWHAGDAGFLIFLRDHGRLLMFFGACLVAFGACKTVLPRLAFSLRKTRHQAANSTSGRPTRRSTQQWIEVPFQTSDPSRSMRRHHRAISRHLAQTPETHLGAALSDSEDLQGTGVQTRPELHARSSSHSNRARGLPGSGPAAAATSSSLAVAAPKPQRASMPLFELDDTDGERSEHSSDSRTSGDEPQGLFAWTGLGQGNGGSSRSSMDVAPNVWRKASGVLLLPAYVMSRIGSPGRGYGRDSVVTPDLPCHHSPADSWSSSSHMDGDTPSHSRRPSFVEMASQLLPRGWVGPSGSANSAHNTDLELSSTKDRGLSALGEGGDRTPLAIGTDGTRRTSVLSNNSASAWLDQDGSTTPTHPALSQCMSDGFLTPSAASDVAKSGGRAAPASYRTPPPPYDAEAASLSVLARPGSAAPSASSRDEDDAERRKGAHQ
ncbi:unnamed protein product [Parajaminaea phylloscopi]